MIRVVCLYACAVCLVSSSPAAAENFGEAYWDRLAQVHIEVNPVEWNKLRNVNRLTDPKNPSLESLAHGAQACQPGGPDIPGLLHSPFEYHSANVTINGENRVNVGLKKKGMLGSGQENIRISMKIKVKKFDKNTLAFNGLEELTFNGARQGQGERFVECLVYDIYRKAGLHAPRCGYAHVVVNREDLGLYGMVESYTERWFQSKHGFDSSDKIGNMYKAGSGDFVDGYAGTFEQATNKDNMDYSPIGAVVKALAGDNPVREAAELIDLDYFLSFWALETILALWDSATSNTNNYNVYADPARGGKFVYLPWGPDAGMGNYGNGNGNSNSNTIPWGGLPSVYTTKANNKLAGVLYNDPTWGAKYRERVKSLIGPGKPFDPDAINQRIDRLHTVLKPAVMGKNLTLSVCASSLTQAEQGFFFCSVNNVYQQSPEIFAKAVDATKAFVAGRSKFLLSVVDTTQWPWPYKTQCSGWSDAAKRECSKLSLCQAVVPADVVQCSGLVGGDCSSQPGCTWTGATSGGSDGHGQGQGYLCGLNPAISALDPWKFVTLYPNKEVAQCLKAPAMIFCPHCTSADLVTAKQKCKPECFMEGGPCDLTQNADASWLTHSTAPPLLAHTSEVVVPSSSNDNADGELTQTDRASAATTAATSTAIVANTSMAGAAMAAAAAFAYMARKSANALDAASAPPTARTLERAEFSTL